MQYVFPIKWDVVDLCQLRASCGLTNWRMRRSRLFQICEPRSQPEIDRCRTTATQMRQFWRRRDHKSDHLPLDPFLRPGGRRACRSSESWLRLRSAQFRRFRDSSKTSSLRTLSFLSAMPGNCFQRSGSSQRKPRAVQYVSDRFAPFRGNDLTNSLEHFAAFRICGNADRRICTRPSASTSSSSMSCASASSAISRRNVSASDNVGSASRSNRFGNDGGMRNTKLASRFD